MADFLRSKAIHNGTLMLCQGNETRINESKGNMSDETPFAVASISKLYTYTLIFQLIDAGRLRTQTTLPEILPATITRRLPNAPQVTIRHLVDQTSGWANHELDRQPNGTILMNELMQRDRRVNFTEALDIVARMPALAQPGEQAHYADINALLLGKIAETVTGKTAEQLLNEHICAPLGLEHTHWAREDESIVPFYNGKNIVRCPRYLSSQLYQGGIIAPNSEVMRFVQAFFREELFALVHIAQPVFRPIQMRPLRYGSGMMQLTISPLVSPFFGGVREMRGHSGFTGSFAYYCPQKDAIITGTTNQLRYHPYPILARAFGSCDQR
ncbi:MAG: serine hydrolase domain-containing protein [Actinomycetaceae bacterium]|nr:serine hydrolase domain-containing protein [Actinomycetaceae bacterium]